MIHRSMRSTPGSFDVCPVPQHKGGNIVLIAIQLFGFLFFAAIIVGILVLPFPPFLPKYMLVIPPAFFVLLSFYGIYEIWEESVRISKISRAITGNRRGKEQLIEGIYAGQPVWFSLAKKPLSINYAIRVDGQKTLSLAVQLRRYLADRLDNSGMKGYRVLIISDALVLSKPVMFVFQIKPEKTTAIFDMLVNAKRGIIEKFPTDQELFPILE